VAPNGPLLVFGPRSTTYDFGPQHPLTPRRFGPGIDLLRAVGAEPSIEPEPATDEQLRAVHEAAYIGVVRRFSEHTGAADDAAVGIGSLDKPAFAGTPEAGAAVAGGSRRAMDSILRGETRHAYHPGGGLHHAMPARASGFCIYDDPALAIARARAEGLRVLYVDLDVHHGDGVQEIFYSDPGVLTVSFHESGRYLFPQTGFADELGVGPAAGTAVNVPFEPYSGEASWLPAVQSLVPALAATFGPDVIVSQHGADAHAWDPLAHLRVTTTAMGEAARLVDGVAHRWAAGRWLATGGGGYDAYRVVPRAWALTWLAAAHRETPAETPSGWRERWAVDAERWGQSPMPRRFTDEPNAGLAAGSAQDAADRVSAAMAAAVRDVVLPQLVRVAIERGWSTPEVSWPPVGVDAAPTVDERAEATREDVDPTVLASVDRATLERLVLLRRVAAPSSTAELRVLLDAALRDEGTLLTVAVVDDICVGLALSTQVPDRHARELLALGVAAPYRRRGIGRALLERHLETAGGEIEVAFGVAERDVVEPLEVEERGRIARRLLTRAGFGIGPAARETARIDRWAFTARRGS